MAKRRTSMKQEIPLENRGDAGAGPTPQSGALALFDTPHQVERDVRRELLSQPDLHFSSLVVRRVGGGVVCLEGVLETSDPRLDVTKLALRVAGVDRVLNRLVVRNSQDAALTAQSN